MSVKFVDAASSLQLALIPLANLGGVPDVGEQVIAVAGGVQMNVQSVLWDLGQNLITIMLAN
jgi:hypothetical protein